MFTGFQLTIGRTDGGQSPDPDPVAALYLALTALGTLWTDYLWLGSIGFEGFGSVDWASRFFSAPSASLWPSWSSGSASAWSIGCPPLGPLRPDRRRDDRAIPRVGRSRRIRQIRFWLTGGLVVLSA